jgi:hypothetical protein
MSHPRPLSPRARGITEENTGVSRVHERQCEDYARCGPDAIVVYGPCPPLKRIPCAGPAQLLDRLSSQGRKSLHNGLDHSGSAFAPCLLGCPGRPRQGQVRVGTAVARRPTQMAGPGIGRYRSTSKNQTEQRTLNPRVPGSSPWRRTRTDLGFRRSRSFLMCPVCPYVGSVFAAVGRAVAAGLVRPAHWRPGGNSAGRAFVRREGAGVSGGLLLGGGRGSPPGLAGRSGVAVWPVRIRWAA